MAMEGPPISLDIDLPSKTIATETGDRWYFEIDEKRQHQLVNGLDEIGLTLEHEAQIKVFEANHLKQHPWL